MSLSLSFFFPRVSAYNAPLSSCHAQKFFFSFWDDVPGWKEVFSIMEVLENVIGF